MASKTTFETPIIQILDKNDYTKQHMVALEEYKPSALAAESIRVRTTLFSLTTNNFSYARMGHLMGWWDIHPLPASTPKEFSDPSRFGRISCWGYGQVLESTASFADVGSWVYGYLPIGTLPVDMKIVLSSAATKSGLMAQIRNVDPARSKQLGVYNQLSLFPSSWYESPSQEHDLALNSLMYILFETGHGLNRSIFEWDTSITPVHPSGTSAPWSHSDADIKDATVLMFSGSGKTALAFAWQLEKQRPKDFRPSKIVAIGSARSQGFIKNTNFYDEVLTYEADSDSQTLASLISSTGKIVALDFGARDGAFDRWTAKLAALPKARVMTIRVGGEVVPMAPARVTQNMKAGQQAQALMLNASGVRDASVAAMGEEFYFGEGLTDWARFKKAGAIPGMKVDIEQGMAAAAQGWRDLCEGKVGPEKALVFRV